MQIKVDALGGLGDGIASYDGKPVFIAKACPGDTLDITIVHENRNGLQGVINTVIEPGPSRRTAPCFYYDRCGGCTLQHFDEGFYREFKLRMLHSALERAGFARPAAEVMFIAPASRRRVEFKAKHDGDAVALAFHDLRSHAPTAVDVCLLLVPELQALITPLNHALSNQPFSPYLFSVALTKADRGVDMVLTFKQFDLHALPPLDKMAKSLGITRISVRTPESKSLLMVQSGPVEMHLGGYDVPLPVESFLQATREGQMELTRVALEATHGAANVVDLFCGIGSYSFPLAQRGKAHAVELDAGMIECVKAVGAPSLTSKARDLFRDPLGARELSSFDAAVINPPRLGAKAQTQELANSSVNTVVMVSCNPATFARDALILKERDFALASVRGIDQFVWSPHLEIVAVFTR